MPSRLPLPRRLTRTAEFSFRFLQCFQIRMITVSKLPERPAVSPKQKTHPIRARPQRQAARLPCQQAAFHSLPSQGKGRAIAGALKLLGYRETVGDDVRNRSRK